MTEALQQFDTALFLAINSLHAPFLDPVMVLLSGLGIWSPLILFFIWQSYRTYGGSTLPYFVLFLLLSVIASDVTSSYILKNIVSRLRPCRVEELKSLIYSFGQKCGGKYGFVSSHAANSMALFFFSIKTLNLRHWWIVLLLFPLSVSYSRIYLGVHYPGDVVVGSLVGLGWAYVFSSIFNTQGASRCRSHPAEDFL